MPFSPLCGAITTRPSLQYLRCDCVVEERQNQLSVLLGNGFYNEQGGRYTKMKVSYGPPTLYCSLEIELKNGRTVCIVSDGSWKYSPSSITFNSIYGGEDEDARITPSRKPVVIQKGPRGVLRQQMATAGEDDGILRCEEPSSATLSKLPRLPMPNILFRQEPLCWIWDRILQVSHRSRSVERQDSRYGSISQRP